jgi:hypothetical protein
MWGDKQKQDEPKQDAKPPEQSKAEADALIERMSAMFQEKINPIIEKVNSFDTRFETIEQSTRRPVQKVEDREKVSVLDNEDQAFAERLLPLNAGLIMMNARITEDEVYREMDAKGWGSYIPKAKEALANVNLQSKGSPEYPNIVRNTVTMIVGREAMDKGLKFDGGKQTFFMEDSNSRISGDNTPSQLDARLVEMATDGRIEMVKGEHVTAGDVRTFLQKKLGIKDVDAFMKTVTS